MVKHKPDCAIHCECKHVADGGDCKWVVRAEAAEAEAKRLLAANDGLRERIRKQEIDLDFYRREFPA